jgi:hypothetical protein
LVAAPSPQLVAFQCISRAAGDSISLACPRARWLHWSQNNTESDQSLSTISATMIQRWRPNCRRALQTLLQRPSNWFYFGW